MRTIVTIWALMALASVSSAAPELVWESIAAAAPERTLYTVSVSDDQSASWAVNIDFWGCCGGPLMQRLAFGALDINFGPLDSMPDAWFRHSSYDSWVFSEWQELATGVSGPRDAPFHIHAGTPGGEAYGTLHLAELVVGEGGCICWDGVVTRLGVDYPVSGWIPEPAVCGVVAFGATCLRRRKRKA